MPLFFYRCQLILVLLFLLSACVTVSGNKDLPTILPSITVGATHAPTQEPQALPTTAPTAAHGTAVSTQGEEEDGIPQEQDLFIPPIPPANVRAYKLEEGVELHWQGTGSDIVDHYIIFRRSLNTENWIPTATISVSDDNRGEYIWLDHTLDQGASYEYAVAAVDGYGNESVLSEPASLEADP